MKIISWNVNGLRAVLKKGLEEFLKQTNPHILCLQETKLQIVQVPEQFTKLLTRLGYTCHWGEATKKGYSGIATFSKSLVLREKVGIEKKEFDNEGRTLTLEYDNFYLVNCYFPNSQPGLLRLDYKLAYNDALLEYVENLVQKKNVIICGDFNVAHQPIDLKNPSSNKNNPGFYIDEKNWFSKLLQSGFIDTFRRRHPQEEGHYTWWSYRLGARSKNVGWRIDYFLVNNQYDEKIKSSTILKTVMGSDHCPIQIEVE